MSHRNPPQASRVVPASIRSGSIECGCGFVGSPTRPLFRWGRDLDPEGIAGWQGRCPECGSHRSISPNPRGGHR